MKPTLAAIAVAFTFCLTLIGFSTPAQAYPASCNSGGYICFYNNNPPESTPDAQTYYTVYAKSVCYTATPQEQRASYISNPSSINFVVYLNTTCSGASAPIYAHSSGAMNSTWNNKIRSIVRVS